MSAMQTRIMSWPSASLLSSTLCRAGAGQATRSLDVAAACLALLVLAPLLVLVALAIRLDSPGPVLFRQTRTGLNGRVFRIYKFRTMRVQEDGPVVRQVMRGDARVTRVG